MTTGDEGNLFNLKLIEDVAGLGYTVTSVKASVEETTFEQLTAAALFFQQLVMLVADEALPA